jgi:hypothetical protein
VRDSSCRALRPPRHSASSARSVVSHSPPSAALSALGEIRRVALPALSGPLRARRDPSCRTPRPLRPSPCSARSVVSHSPPSPALSALGEIRRVALPALPGPRRPRRDPSCRTPRPRPPSPASARSVVSQSADCQTTRPTKKGPRRSRYSDVCCVLRIAWTTADSGNSSFPTSPMTKSLSLRSSPWQARRTSCA